MFKFRSFSTTRRRLFRSFASDFAESIFFGSAVFTWNFDVLLFVQVL